jgi:type III secretory pathway component EscR
MKRTKLQNLGGLQSVLFCAGIYMVALFFSIFVCSAIFNAVNAKKSVSIETVQAKDASTMYASIKP